MIQKIRLKDFRNFKDSVFEFSPNTTVIIGPNASGKTNLLESLFLLSTGKSFKASLEEEMINYNEELARAKGLLEDKSTLEVVLTKGQMSVGDDRYEKTPRKKLLVKGISKRLIDFAGIFKVVLFAPQDLDLVSESPSIRRKFLDSVMSQVDREYRRALLSYEKGVRQRNRILQKIRDEGASRSQLLFWDKLLIKNGDYISEKRQDLISYINTTPALEDQEFTILYDKSAISEERLVEYAQEEVAAATTLVGPHRDDFVFEIGKKRNLAKYGSRGEQRMGVLWIKLAELSYIEKEAGVRPTLLLDDIFSELDDKHRDVVLSFAKKQQTIITTADPHFILDTDELIKIEL
ncbi:MAG TPA: DNA replication and repair protein RecF [Patescibacteria group bacterium]